MYTKIEIQKSKNPKASERPVIVLISGGPGLSSQSLESLSILNGTFDLCFLDYGSLDNEVKADRAFTYEEVIGDIEKALEKLSRDSVLVGHSFGGIIAAELAERNKISIAGVVCVASPLTEESLNVANTRYASLKTPELKDTEAEWTRKPNLESFRKWFVAQAPLYFRSSNLNDGRELLLQTSQFPDSFLRLREAARRKFPREKMLGIAFKKILIAGSEDSSFPVSVLKKDAETFGFKFELIKEAGHFVHFDQPEAVARVIVNNFIDGTEGSL